jgi:hypothetical protein
MYQKIETESAVACPLQQSLRERVTCKRLSITVSIFDTLATSCWAKKIITKDLYFVEIYLQVNLLAK